MPSFHPIDLGIGICIAAAMRLAVYIKGKNAKKFRHNQEYGSARWGTAADIAPMSIRVLRTISSSPKRKA